jgi:hypothetical protein
VPRICEGTQAETSTLAQPLMRVGVPAYPPHQQKGAVGEELPRNCKRRRQCHTLHTHTHTLKLVSHHGNAGRTGAT